MTSTPPSSSRKEKQKNHQEEADEDAAPTPLPSVKSTPRLGQRRKSTSLSALDDQQKFLEMLLLAEEEKKKGLKINVTTTSSSPTPTQAKKRRSTNEENLSSKEKKQWQPRTLRANPKAAAGTAYKSSEDIWRGTEGAALPRHNKEKKKGHLTLRLMRKKEKTEKWNSTELSSSEVLITKKNAEKRASFPANTEWKRTAHAQTESDLATYMDVLPEESQAALVRILSNDPTSMRTSPRNDGGGSNKTSPRQATHPPAQPPEPEEYVVPSLNKSGWRKRDELSILKDLMENNASSSTENISAPLSPTNGPGKKQTPRKEDKKVAKKKKAATNASGASKNQPSSNPSPSEETEEEKAAKILLFRLLMDSHNKKEEEARRLREKVREEEEEALLKQAKEEEEEAEIAKQEEGLSLEEKYARLQGRYEREILRRRAAEKNLLAVEILMRAGNKAGFEATVALWKDTRKLPPSARLRTIRERTVGYDSSPAFSPRSPKSAFTSPDITPRFSPRESSGGMHFSHSAELIRSESSVIQIRPDAQKEPSRPSLMFAKKVAISFSRDLNKFLQENPGDFNSAKAQAFLSSFNVTDEQLMEGGIIGENDDDEESLLLGEGGYNNEEDLLFSDAVEVKRKKSDDAGENSLWERAQVNFESDSEESLSDTEDDDDDDDSDEEEDDGALQELAEGGRAPTTALLANTTTLPTHKMEAEKKHPPIKSPSTRPPSRSPLTRKDTTSSSSSAKTTPRDEVERLQRKVEKKEGQVAKLRNFFVALVQEQQEKMDASQSNKVAMDRPRAEEISGKEGSVEDMSNNNTHMERTGSTLLYKMMSEGALSLLLNLPEGGKENSGNLLGSAKLSGSTNLFESLKKGSEVMLRPSPHEEKEKKKREKETEPGKEKDKGSKREKKGKGKSKRGHIIAS